MKKKLTILLAVLFLITAFAGCSSKNEETQSANDGNYRASSTQGEEQTILKDTSMPFGNIEEIKTGEIN